MNFGLSSSMGETPTFSGNKTINGNLVATGAVYAGKSGGGGAGHVVLYDGRTPPNSVTLACTDGSSDELSVPYLRATYGRLVLDGGTGGAREIIGGGTNSDIVISPSGWGSGGKVQINRGLQVNADNVVVATAKTPAGAGDAGTPGMIAWDAGYIYVCVAANTWKRAALATW